MKNIVPTVILTAALVLTGCNRQSTDTRPPTVSTACDAVYHDLISGQFFNVDAESGRKPRVAGVYTFREALPLVWEQTPADYRPTIYRKRAAASLDCRDSQTPRLTITAPALHALTYNDVFSYRRDASESLAAEWSEIVGYATPGALRAFNPDAQR